MITSCASKSGMDKIVCTFDDVPNEQFNAKCFMTVPKNYHFTKIIAGNSGYEIRLTYEDGSIIYLSHSPSTRPPNYENIKNLGDSLLQYRFQNKELAMAVNCVLGYDAIQILSDTIQLSGMNQNKLFWKDICFYGVSIGYDNVRTEKIVFYDRCIESFKMKFLKSK